MLMLYLEFNPRKAGVRHRKINHGRIESIKRGVLPSWILLGIKHEGLLNFAGPSLDRPREERHIRGETNLSTVSH